MRSPVKIIFCFLLGLSILSCKKENDPAPVVPSGKVVFSIDHCVNGEPVRKNELVYTNAAGNEYLITEIMYFISDITFYRSDGTKTMIGLQKDIFYVNDDFPDTKRIQFGDEIPAGNYDSISFIFGITEEKNISNRFPNPPEAIMAWPVILGGGYHYMMMNGKWMDTNGMINPFNFHLGIGQLYKGNDYNVDSIYAYVQNFFRVSLPGSDFIMADRDTLTFQLTMNIEEWFEDPHICNHNFRGGAMMQKQPAMQMAKENGWDVFSIKQQF